MGNLQKGEMILYDEDGETVLFRGELSDNGEYYHVLPLSRTNMKYVTRREVMIVAGVCLVYTCLTALILVILL